MTTTDISSAAAALGRKGGYAKSEAKTAAVRANGAKGGRPTIAATVYRIGTAPRVYSNEPGVALVMRKGLASLSANGETVQLTTDGKARFRADNM